MKWKWILLSVVVLGCNDYSECGVTDYSEEVYISFYNSSDAKSKSVSFQSIEIAFSNGTNYIASDLEATNNIILPLDMSTSNTNMVLTTGNIAYDLVMGYNAMAIIENPDCGPIFMVTAITAQSEVFDSVAVKVTELSKNLAPHVEIYF